MASLLRTSSDRLDCASIRSCLREAKRKRSRLFRSVLLLVQAAASGTWLRTPAPELEHSPERGASGRRRGRGLGIADLWTTIKLSVTAAERLPALLTSRTIQL